MALAGCRAPSTPPASAENKSGSRTDYFTLSAVVCDETKPTRQHLAGISEVKLYSGQWVLFCMSAQSDVGLKHWQF